MDDREAVAQEIFALRIFRVKRPAEEWADKILSLLRSRGWLSPDEVANLTRKEQQ